jgi:hypothetical protein
MIDIKRNRIDALRNWMNATDESEIDVTHSEMENLFITKKSKIEEISTVEEVPTVAANRVIIINIFLTIIVLNILFIYNI